MAFSSVFDELESKLTSLYPEITFGFGEKDLAHAGSPPRIVWVPTTVKHGPPTKESKNPRSLYTRARTIVAHVWAVSESRDSKADFDATDDLVHDLLVCLHQTGWGSLENGDEQWIKPAESDLGYAALVSFVVHSPVSGKTYRTVRITGVDADTTGSAPADQKIDWSEP